ncbi:MAG: ABC transporter substrate-binding protein/permease [Longicatena sp.]
MKKILAKLSIVVVTICACLLPIQAQEETGGKGDLLQQILDRGELIVGTSPDFPPNEFIDTTKEGQEQYVGSDIELAKYIATQLGVKLTIKALDFDAVLASVQTKQIDLAITGITNTPDREAAMEMSDAYFDEEGESGWQGVLIKEDKKDTYKSLTDLKGKTIAVQSGSLQDYYVKSQLKDTKVQYITQLGDGVNLLKNGSVDAVASAYGTGKEFVKNSDGLYMSDKLLFKLNQNYTGNRIGAPKGETALINRINDIIKDVRSKKLYETWYQNAMNFSNNKIEGNFMQKTFKLLQRYGGMFFNGLLVTLGLAFVTVFFGTLFGALFAIIKLSKNKLVQFLSSAYVEIIRGTPLLLQLWIFVTIFAQFGKMPMIVSVIIALVINSSAYVAEIIRGGIQSVDKGQREAAKSLGMSDKHTMVKIIFPQAIKNILPALGNEFIMMVKETSLASSFYIGELMTVNNIVKTATYLQLQPLLIAGVIYFIVTFTLSKGVSYMERRMSVSD